MAASIQNPFYEDCEGLRSPLPREQLGLRARPSSGQRQAREDVLEQPLACRQSGFGELADDLRGRGHQLGAAGRLRPSRRRFRPRTQSPDAGRRPRAPVGARRARRHGAERLCVRGGRRTGLGGCSARLCVRRRRRNRARRPEAFAAGASRGGTAVARLARAGFLARAGLRARAGAAVAPRAAARRALERWGRVRGRFASTPPSLRRAAVRRSCSNRPRRTSLLKAAPLQPRARPCRVRAANRCDRTVTTR